MKGLSLILFQMCEEQSFSNRLKVRLQAYLSLIGTMKAAMFSLSNLTSLMLKECAFVGVAHLAV